MITAQLNRPDFEYDIHSLVKAFFPAEDVTVSTEIKYTGEEISFHLVISFQTGEVEILLRDEKQTPVLELKQTAEFSTDSRKDQKNQLKRALYQILSAYTQRSLPWGTLTGIRPTKIPMAMLENGMTEDEIWSEMKETYLAGDDKIRLCLEVAMQEKALLAQLDYEKGYSLYIGIPFCPSTCLYCSFTSYPAAVWAKRMDEYLDALEKEILFAAEACKNKKINTIYFGGGTPTSLNPEQLKRLISLVRGSFDLSACVEFTVEAGRPDSITREKLQVLKDEDVTRISINPQTMKEETLKIIGRHHTVGQTIESFQMARELGFDNINMDLIIGLPNESIEDVKDTLRQISELGPDNLTVHSLALKRAARLQMFREEYQDLTFENTLETIQLTEDAAREMGLVPYYLYRQKNIAGNFENVGYAKPGKAGIYNILIMEEKQTILALGAGASSKFVLGEGKKAVRVENVKDVETYLQRIDEMIDKKRKTMEELGWL